MTIKHGLKQLARHLGIEVRRFNAVESEMARVVRQLHVHAIDLVIDVGANDGGYGRMLRAAGYAGPIFSFEPLTDAHAALLRCTAGDRLWHVAPRTALGEGEGEATINIAGNLTSSSLLAMVDLHLQAAPESQYCGVEPVPLRRLEQIEHTSLQSASSPFLKVDTQGYELPVLRGAGRLLERVVGVQVELSLVPLYAEQETWHQVVAFLEASGFALWNVLPGFVDPRSGRMLQFDGVFFRD